MKLRTCLVFLAILFVCNFNLWAAEPGQTEPSDGQSVSDPDIESEFNRLISKAADEGSVPIMVFLKYPDVISAKDKSEDAQEKRIEAIQDAFLKDMPKRKKRTVNRLRTLPVLSLSANATELNQLHNSPQVAYVVEDKINRALSLSAAVDKIGGTAGWALGYTGAGQTIAIIDNGIDKTHPYLAGRVVSEACFSSNIKSQKITSGCRKKKNKDTKPGAASVTCAFEDFQCTHGTLLAGLAAGNSGATDLSGSGAAPGATIIAIKANSLIKNKNLCGTSTPCSIFLDSDLIRGLEHVYKLRKSYSIAAANISIGSNSTPKQCKKSPFKRTVSKLKAAGIATIAASGNGSSTNKINAPACVAGVIAVGASAVNADIVEPYSNSSSQLSLLAPGGRNDDNNPGDRIALIMPGVTQSGKEVVAFGTSLSGALVTGSWAALKSHKPSATVDQILQALTSTGVRITDPKSGVVTPRIQVNQAHAALP